MERNMLYITLIVLFSLIIIIEIFLLNKKHKKKKELEEKILVRKAQYLVGLRKRGQ